MPESLFSNPNTTADKPSRHSGGTNIELGIFLNNLAVKDIKTSKESSEKLGFTFFTGSLEDNWVIMKNGDSIIGLFQGVFDKNIMTFNPGWDSSTNAVDPFTDIALKREHQGQAEEINTIQGS